MQRLNKGKEKGKEKERERENNDAQTIVTYGAMAMVLNMKKHPMKKLQ